jgi:hypothetical protein
MARRRDPRNPPFWKARDSPVRLTYISRERTASRGCEMNRTAVVLCLLGAGLTFGGADEPSKKNPNLRVSEPADLSQVLIHSTPADLSRVVVRAEDPTTLTTRFVPFVELEKSAGGVPTCPPNTCQESCEGGCMSTFQPFPGVRNSPSIFIHQGACVDGVVCVPEGPGTVSSAPVGPLGTKTCRCEWSIESCPAFVFGGIKRNKRNQIVVVWAPYNGYITEDERDPRCPPETPTLPGQ